MSVRAAIVRPRWRKVLSDLWDNKLRTTLVVLSIAVGVFSVGMIAGAYGIISTDMTTSYASANPANIVIWTDAFDDEMVNSIKNLPGIKNAEGRRIVSVRATSSGDAWTGLDLIALPDFEVTTQDTPETISRLVPLEGNPIPVDRQVLIESGAWSDFDAQVGDILLVQLPDDTIREMPVVGTVQDQTTGAGDFLAPPLGYVTFDTLPWLRQSQDYNRLLVTVIDQNNPSLQSNDEAFIRSVSKKVTDKLENSGRQVYRTELNQTNEHPMGSTVKAILGVLGALGILIVFLSSSLITNTLNALLNQHLRYIGVMKLIGARSYQVLGMYLTLILIFGLIALLVAIPLGGQAAYALAELIADKMNFNLLGYRVIPTAILLQVIIALVVPLAAGFMPVRSGSRIKVQKAISGYDPGRSQTGGSWFDRMGGRVRWLSRPMLISLRNTFRRRGRLLLTLFTLTMGGAIFIAVFNVQLALENHVSRVGHYFLADVTLSFDRSYRLSKVEQTALEIPNVQAVEGWAYVGGEMLYPDGSLADNLAILAPPADSQLVEPILIDGRWVVPGDKKAIAISEAVLSTFPDLKAGDSMRLKINGREDDWIVVGIFKFVNQGGRLLAYASYEYISEMLNQANQASSFRVVTDQHDLAYQEMMSARIDRYFRDQGFHVQDVEAGLATLQTASEGLDILINFLLIMALLTASVGSMGLTGTMGMNVLERTREIGVMRAIGAVDMEIIKSVITEGVFIGMISWFMGALLSFPISSMLSTIISLAIFSTPIDMAFTPTGFLIWMGVVLVLSVLASVLPARNAARLTIREVLAYE